MILLINFLGKKIKDILLDINMLMIVALVRGIETEGEIERKFLIFGNIVIA